MGGERLNTKILKVLKFSHVAIDSELPWGFPCGSADKDSACNVGTGVRFLGWEDPLEKEKATHSSILAWRFSWIV